jgi:signal transduction histidine kinase
MRGWRRIVAALGGGRPQVEPPPREAPCPSIFAEAFDRAFIVLEEGGPRLVSGQGVLARCLRLLAETDQAVDALPNEPEALIAALARRDTMLDAARRALETEGAAFDIDVACAGGLVRISGRTAGALALMTIGHEARSPRTAGDLSARATSALENALARQSSALDRVLDVVADGVAMFDADRRLVFHNDAFARLWGLEPAWLAEGPTHGVLLDRLRRLGRLPETSDFSRFRAEELARHQRLEASPQAVWRVAGERLLGVVSLPRPAGGLILVFSDITSEVRLKSQFNHLIQVQQATLDKLTDAVAVFGPDARLKLHNDAFRTLWRLPPEAVADQAAFDDIAERCIARLHDRRFWVELKGRICDPDPAARAAVHGEVAVADARRLTWQSRPLPDGATLVSFADVTDARRVEAALLDREVALGKAEALTREFVGSVSYELRTPLTTILGYAELLEAAGDGLSPRARGWVGAVRSAAADLGRLVDDILTFAELDAGELALELEETDMVLRARAASARWAPAASEGGVTISLDGLDETAALLADAARLDRILDHLVEHALRRTPPGGRIELSVRRSPGEVCLRVADSGRSIPFHIQAHIFDRFRGDEGTGAGIGLALVKALVELHGGWVAFESEPGRGAVFALHLPEAGAPGD